MYCVVINVSSELGYGSGIANRKHAVSLTYLDGLAYSLKNLPSKAVATVASTRREYHNGGADQQAQLGNPRGDAPCRRSPLGKGPSHLFILRLPLGSGQLSEAPPEVRSMSGHQAEE